jgi:hypothetical protein
MGGSKQKGRFLLRFSMNIALRSRKNVVSTIVISIFAVLLLLLSGCSVVNDLQDISAAGNAFLAELGKGNAAGAAALMHSRSLASGDMAAALKENFVDRKLGDATINSTKVENGVGELSGKCNLADGDGKIQAGDLTMQLEKDGDKWKVLNISCKIS